MYIDIDVDLLLIIRKIPSKHIETYKCPIGFYINQIRSNTFASNGNCKPQMKMVKMYSGVVSVGAQANEANEMRSFDKQIGLSNSVTILYIDLVWISATLFFFLCLGLSGSLFSTLSSVSHCGFILISLFRTMVRFRAKLIVMVMGVVEMV